MNWMWPEALSHSLPITNKQPFHFLFSPLALDSGTDATSPPINLWLVVGKLTPSSALPFSPSLSAGVPLNTDDTMIEPNSCFCCASWATCLINRHHPGWLSGWVSPFICFQSLPFLTFWIIRPISVAVQYSGLKRFGLTYSLEYRVRLEKIQV